MIGKATLVVLASTSSCMVDNIQSADVVYHQVMPTEECEKVAEQLRRNQAQGAVCVPVEADHD